MPTSHPRPAIAAVAAALALPAPALAVADAGRMYVTSARSRVQLRMLTVERLTKGGNVTFDAKCSGGDTLVKISRAGRVNHSTKPAARLGVRIVGTVTARAFTGTLTSWGPGCRATQPFTARRAG
jgi:hypothetical protein